MAQQKTLAMGRKRYCAFLPTSIDYELEIAVHHTEFGEVVAIPQAHLFCLAARYYFFHHINFTFIPHLYVHTIRGGYIVILFGNPIITSLSGAASTYLQYHRRHIGSKD